MTDTVRRKLASQCRAFADETTRGLRDVVPKAQPLAVIASASSAAASTVAGNAAVATLQGRATAPPSRAHFVDCALALDQSFGAGNTMLWGVPAADPLASERNSECNALGSTVEHLTCIEASAGHPNVAGARLIADRIIERLDCILAMPGDKTSATAGPVSARVNSRCLTLR